VCFQVALWMKARRLLAVPSAIPSEAARAMADGAWICDVRSHGYFDAKATRIKGSRRLDPNALNQRETEFPPDQDVYLYCTCVREATSARVARELQPRGIRVAVIKGGLRAWKKAGLPLEAVPPAEMALFPTFK
jgi:rhodanese-related sulfurtransferase